MQRCVCDQMCWSPQRCACSCMGSSVCVCVCVCKGMCENLTNEQRELEKSGGVFKQALYRGAVRLQCTFNTSHSTPQLKIEIIDTF